MSTRRFRSGVRRHNRLSRSCSGFPTPPGRVRFPSDGPSPREPPLVRIHVLTIPGDYPGIGHTVRVDEGEYQAFVAALEAT